MRRRKYCRYIGKTPLDTEYNLGTNIEGLAFISRLDERLVVFTPTTHPRTEYLLSPEEVTFKK